MDTTVVRLLTPDLALNYTDIILSTGPYVPAVVPGLPVVIAASDRHLIDPLHVVNPADHPNILL